MSMISYHTQAHKLAEYLNYDIPVEFSNSTNTLTIHSKSSLKTEDIKAVAKIAFDHLLKVFEKGQQDSITSGVQTSLKKANLEKVSSYQITAGGMSVSFEK